MKRLFYFALTTLLAIPAMAGEVSFGKGTLSVRQVARNAVRIQYYEQKTTSELPDWLYVKNDEVSSRDVTVDVDEARQTVTVKDRQGTRAWSVSSFDAGEHSNQHSHALVEQGLWHFME